MAADHLPVLLDDVLRLLAPQPGDVIVDATLGLAGHAARLLQAAGPTAQLIGIDVDPANLARAKERLVALGPGFDKRFRLFHANFSQLPEVLAEVDAARVDVLLADLGIASSQLDDPARGLSFQAAGPLDMRLDPRLERTAADLVNTLPEAELADVLYQLGGETFSRKIARTICRRRIDQRIDTTDELVRVVCSALHVDPLSRKSKIHPATRTFMALRIAVNEELDNLDRLLELAPDVLSPGGRFGVISFHSLEDRRVKQAFAAGAAAGIYQIVTKKPIQAIDPEIAANPRSRSAKFRVVCRTEPGR